MASNRLTRTNIAVGILAGALLGALGFILLFVSISDNPGLPIAYAISAWIAYLLLSFAAKKRGISGGFPVFFLTLGIVFPLCIPLSFLALARLGNYSLATGNGSSSGGSNGGNLASGNYSGTESGVVPRSGSRFGGGGGYAPASEPEVTESAFGQSKSGEAPAAGGPRFGRTTMDEHAPRQVGLHDRIADFDNPDPITITLRDGRNFTFHTLAVIPHKGEVYCVVEAAEALEDIPVGMIGVFKFIHGEDGEELIESVSEQTLLDELEVEFQKLIDAENA